MIMTIRQIPTYFFIVGAGFKAMLIVLWRLYQPVEIYDLLITYDPVGIWVARILTSLFFSHRRIAPTPTEAFVYEIVLTIIFAFECAVLGLVLRMTIQWLRRKRQSSLGSPIS